MNGVDFHAALQTIVRVDRVQDESHRAPIVNQHQNADIAREEAARCAVMPVEAEEAEGKTIDTDDRRHAAEQHSRKRRKKRSKQRKKRPKGNRGYFIDCDA